MAPHKDSLVSSFVLCNPKNDEEEGAIAFVMAELGGTELIVFYLTTRETRNIERAACMQIDVEDIHNDLVGFLAHHPTQGLCEIIEEYHGDAIHIVLLTSAEGKDFSAWIPVKDLVFVCPCNPRGKWADA